MTDDTSKMGLRADLTLEAMAKTFRERNLKYGDNWRKVGQIFAILFPDGITLKTEYDFIMFHWLSWVIGKQTRWVNDGMKPNDSLHDMTVYCAMMETFARLHADDGG